jgi:hypothetical protein
MAAPPAALPVLDAAPGADADPVEQMHGWLMQDVRAKINKETPQHTREFPDVCAFMEHEYGTPEKIDQFAKDLMDLHDRCVGLVGVVQDDQPLDLVPPRLV